MLNNEVLSENSKNSDDKLIKGIKSEDIIVWGGIRIGLIIILITMIMCNLFFVLIKAASFSYILLNVPSGIIIIVFIFIPIGIHAQFDYINKGITISKFSSIPFLLKSCTKKEISFNDIHHFDIDKYLLLGKRYFNLGYYDNSNKFQTLITGQDISCNFNCEFSPELDEIPKKLNDLL